VGEVEKVAEGQYVMVGLCESVPERDMLRHTVGERVSVFDADCVMEIVGEGNSVELAVSVEDTEKVAEGQ